LDNQKTDNKKAVETPKATERQYGAGYKLIGKNYQTPDLYAKVTGQAKYAEDFRAEGMLFCKLLLSPMPHARVKRIFGPRGGKATARRLLAGADERARVPKR